MLSMSIDVTMITAAALIQHRNQTSIALALAWPQASLSPACNPEDNGKNFRAPLELPATGADPRQKSPTFTS
jgi:hypothetical protein